MLSMPDKNSAIAPVRPCPNCGSTNVVASTYRFDPKREEVVHANPRAPGMWGLLAWVVSTFLLNGVVPYLFGSQSSLAAAIPFWVPAALGAGVMLALTARQEWRLTNAARIDSYTCRQCGHEWSLRDGRPVGRR